MGQLFSHLGPGSFGLSSHKNCILYLRGQICQKKKPTPEREKINQERARKKVLA